MSFRHHRVAEAGVAGARPSGSRAGRRRPSAVGFGRVACRSSPAADPEGFVGVAPVRVLDTGGDGPIGVPSAAPLGPGQEITCR